MSTSVSERERLKALASYDILDTAPEESFDRITRLMSACFDVPAATIAFVDANRTWGKAYTGFDPSTEREHSFCLHVVANNEPLVVEDPRQDPRFADNPLVTGEPGVRFYAGAPVRTPHQIPIGTVCLYDTTPRSFSSDERDRLQDFSALVMDALERRRTSSSRRTGRQVAVPAQDESEDGSVDETGSATGTYMPDGILHLDPTGRITGVNDPFVEMTGYTHDELQGKCPGRLLYGPATEEATIKAINRHLDQREAFSMPVLLYRKSGTQYWVRVEAKPLFDDETCTGFRLVLFDITEKRQREDTLNALTSFYEKALKELPVEVAVTDPEGRYLFLNPAAVGDDELREWLIGKTALDYARRREIDPTTFEKRLDMFRAVAQTKEPMSIEENMTTRDGETRYMLRVAHPVTDESGDVIRVFGYGVDVTERKQREHKLREAKERAEEMNRLKTAFLANMSHEIRTPLTSIIGFAEVLADEVTGSREEMADLIQRSGRRLKETLTSVLEFARLEGGEMTLSPERMDLVERVRETVELLRPQAQDEVGTLTVEVPEEDVEVCLDAAAVDRILTNLLTNSIKFTDDGRILVAIRVDDTTVELIVEDTGDGISDHFLERIYQAFEQESVGTDRTHEGIGLGLTITQRLADLMDGSIEIESEKGVGTRVTVTLPRFAAPPEAESQPSDGDAAASNRVLPNPA